MPQLELRLAEPFYDLLAVRRWVEADSGVLQRDEGSTIVVIMEAPNRTHWDALGACQRYRRQAAQT